MAQLADVNWEDIKRKTEDSPELAAVLESEEVKKKISETSVNHNLDIDPEEDLIFHQLTTLFILGFINKDEFIAEAETRINMDKAGLAAAIDDVIRKISPFIPTGAASAPTPAPRPTQVPQHEGQATITPPPAPASPVTPPTGKTEPPAFGSFGPGRTVPPPPQTHTPPPAPTRAPQVTEHAPVPTPQTPPPAPKEPAQPTPPTPPQQPPAPQASRQAPAPFVLHETEEVRSNVKIGDGTTRPVFYTPPASPKPPSYAPPSSVKIDVSGANKPKNVNYTAYTPPNKTSAEIHPENVVDLKDLPR